MENELLYEENIEEIDTYIELSDENSDADTPVSKYEGTAESNSQEIADSILSALEERGIMLTTESGSTTSGATTESGFSTSSGATLDDIYTYVQDIDSHLEYISEHLYEPQEKTIDTPISEYDLTTLLLVGIMALLVIPIVLTAIKNNVYKLR